MRGPFFIVYVQWGDAMLTVMQVSERVSVSVCTVYKLIHQGKLNAHRINSAYRVSEEQLAAFLAESLRAPKQVVVPLRTRFLKASRAESSGRPGAG